MKISVSRESFSRLSYIDPKRGTNREVHRFLQTFVGNSKARTVLLERDTETRKFQSLGHSCLVPQLMIPNRAQAAFSRMEIIYQH